MTIDALPTPSSMLEVAEFDTELVVLVPQDRRTYHLDTAIAVVFDSCRRGDQFGELLDELSRSTGEDRRAVRSWVEQVLEEFTRCGLVPYSSAVRTTSSPSPMAPLSSWYPTPNRHAAVDDLNA